MNQLDHINDQLDQASFMDQELDLSQSEPAEASKYQGSKRGPVDDLHGPLRAGLKPEVRSRP